MADKYDKGNIPKESLEDITGLPDKKTFRSTINKIFNEGILKLVEGEDCTHSIIMLDVDFFKSINDLYSHVHGDQVLARIGHILGSYTPKEEAVCLIGEWGGEEFLMVVPYDSRKIAKYIADEIRDQIYSTNFCDIGEERGKALKERITISLGVNYVDLASLVKKAENSKDMPPEQTNHVEYEIEKALEDADVALDYAKFMGRDRVEILCEEVEKVIQDLSFLRRLYFNEAHRGSDNPIFNDPFLENNILIRERIKKHFHIIETEINPKDTRTQAVFADNLYKMILEKQDDNQRKEFMQFVKKYVSGS